jgi:hypothetical protein
MLITKSIEANFLSPVEMAPARMSQTPLPGILARILILKKEKVAGG